MAAHRYWRLYITETNGGSYASCAAMQLRVSSGGSNLSITGSGTASASSIYSGSYPASDAFDANTTTTRWNSTNGAGVPQWLKWDFGAGLDQDINHLTLYNSVSPEGTANIKTAILQYSDDDAAWTNWIFVNNHPVTDGVSAEYVWIEKTMSFDLAVAAPGLSMFGGDGFDLSIPAPTLEAYGSDYFDLAIPAPLLTMYGPWEFDLSIPAPRLTMTGGTATPNSIDVQIPAPRLDMLFASRFNLSIPAPTMQFEVTTTILMRFDLAIPAPTLEMSGTKSESISLDVSIQAPTLQARGGAFVTGVIPAPTADITITTGGTISLDASIPAPSIEYRMSSGGTITVDVQIPAPVAGPYGIVDASIPAPRLEMTLRLVVTVTYEAYAINLNPSNKAGIHEATRYTGMPFDGIVRHQGAYYGWGPTGLYLLGGDTDAGAAIPWTWKTAVTNFGSRQMKVVRETFMHGRLGPTVTASVSIGEAADVTYAAVIVRGSAGQAHRIKYGKGLKAEYWSFGLADVLGSTMDIDSMQHEPQPISRKV